MKRMSADEAAEIIQHDQMVAFSGFTPAGSPKALPAAIARRADELHRAQKPFQIRLLTGASISAAADDALSAADAVSWRAPYQTASGLRQKINQGQVKFVDLHLSEVAQMVNYGFFGEIDVAVIEASAIAPDGRVWLTSGIGNAPTWLLRAKKVIIELNHYHSPRVAELADIVIPGARRGATASPSFIRWIAWAAGTCKSIRKRLSLWWRPSCPTPETFWITIIRFVRKLPITWSPFCWKRWLADASRLNFCRCKAAWAISTTRSWRGWAKIRISPLL
jgi:hypothetical protein